MTVIVFCSLVAAAVADDGTFFREQVAPILERHCVGCHQGEKPKGGLDLTTARAALAGGESGAPWLPGKPEESLLVDYISGDKPEMPKDAPRLRAEEVLALRRWISEGARWPAELTLHDKKSLDANWWSLVPLAKVAVPADRRSLDPHSGRCFHSRKTAAGAAGALGRSRSPHAHPPADVRPARPAADARRRSTHLSATRAPDAYERPGRSAAGFAALWRTLGAALAGRRALRRVARLRQGQAAAQRLALSRLRDRQPERRQALRSVRRGADRRRRALS